jgi:hypothetical protein
MTTKFARRFVMGVPVITHLPHCYVRTTLESGLAVPPPPSKEKNMKNSLLATLSAVAIVAATTQFAAAGERQHVRKPARSTATATEQFRNANAAWTAPQPQADGYRYSGGYSAPAGH